MNYLKVYCNLIRKAENRTPPEGYTEKHHTFPVSIFGKNNRIVVLTAREHYVAHALLEKICIKRYGLNHYKTQKMICAHLAMSCKRNSKNKYINSYLYENLKTRYVNSISGENNHNYGKIYTEEEREYLSKKLKGIPKSKEHKEKIRKGKTGKPVSVAHRKNLGHNKGKKWWNNGKENRRLSVECPGEGWVIGMNCPCSEERKEKISIKRKMRVDWKHKEETKIKISKSHSKYIYELKSPNGEVFITNNLTNFCKENPQYGLDRRIMCKVSQGKQRHHKGWTVRILEHLT
jgi:hypothetical protein